MIFVELISQISVHSLILCNNFKNVTSCKDIPLKLSSLLQMERHPLTGMDTNFFGLGALPAIRVI